VVELVLVAVYKFGFMKRSKPAFGPIVIGDDPPHAVFPEYDVADVNDVAIPKL
jgi:hypothetical protein